LAQHPQGNLTGPGLLSTSPHTSSSHTTFQTGFPWVTRFATLPSGSYGYQTAY